MINNTNKVRNDGDIFEAILGASDTGPVANLQLPDPGLMEFYQQRANRTLWLTGEVTEDILIYEQMIFAWNKEDKNNGIPVNERKPIILCLSGPGGDLFSAFSMISCIKMSKTKIITVNVNYCFSADALIYIHGHERYCFENSTALLHLGSGSSSGNYSDQQESNKHWKKMVETMKDMICNQTTISKQMLSRRLKSDWYIGDQEQVEYGLCSKIIDDIDMIL